MMILDLDASNYLQVTVTELVKGTVTYFPCDQWLDKDEGDGQIRRQLTATKKSTDTRKGCCLLFVCCFSLPKHPV